MEFDGTLVKNNTNNTVLNNDIIAWEGFKSNPDIQQDKDSYTDDNGDTQRTLLPHVKQKIWIKFLDITDTQKAHIQTVFPSRKKVSLTYWNEERENYYTADFYIPDITWVIQGINKTTKKRKYSGFELTLISYGEAVT